jgi:glycosyltransferase involved in cell wall biosynthesis
MVAVTTPTTQSETLVVLIPVYNDWVAVEALLKLLDTAFQESQRPNNLHVLLIDDGSTHPPTPSLRQAPYSAIDRVDILHLRRNLGHQRAIACGLCHVEEHIPCYAVVVMDGDGEDVPTDVLQLLNRYDEFAGEKVIFAERARRTESFLFRLFYMFYKAVHLLLTGQRVKVGNFSVLPRTLLTRMVVVSDLWNHYSAAIFKARLPIDMIPIARGYRLDGKSHMNFVSLVVHGLSAMSVYGDRIGVRLLFTAAVGILMVLVFLAITLIMRFGMGVGIPQWALLTLAVTLIMLPQFLMLALIFVFLILSGRDSSSFLPIRDYVFFVQKLHTLYEPQRVEIPTGSRVEEFSKG